MSKLTKDELIIIVKALFSNEDRDKRKDKLF